MDTTLYLSSNALHVFSMYVFITAIFGKSAFPKIIEISTYCLYYVINAGVYIFMDNMLLNLLSNIFPLFLIMFQYKKGIANNIFMTVLIAAVGMFLDWMCSCIAPNAVLVKSNTIQSIALVSIAFITRYFFKRDEKIIVNSLYIIVLIINSVGTMVIGLLVGASFNLKSFVIALILILNNLLNFYLYDKYIENMKIRLLYNAVDSINRTYKNQLEIMNESNKRIRLLKHDMKNHIYKIRNYIQSGAYEKANTYIENMDENMVSEKEFVHTGNVDIDCLINYKLSIAKQMNIEFSTKIVLPEKLKVDSFDLTVILGNLLDNSLNALETVKNKILKIDINYSMGMIVIMIENAIGNENKSRRNHEEHGYGLISVRSSLEKYNGILQNEIIDNSYVAKAVLYNTKPNNK